MTPPDPLRAAAENLSDRRTLMDDGWWVSQKEMNALDAALAADTAPLAEPEGHAPRLSAEGVCCERHEATLCGCGNFGEHVSNVDCTAADTTPLDTGYGWNNPAPGTRLWRLRNHPDTLSREDAVLVAQDLAARLAKERDQG